MKSSISTQPSRPGRPDLSGLEASAGTGASAPAAASVFGIQLGDDRAEAESLVIDVFARAYAARVGSFLPTLMGLRATDRTLMAVCGLRSAASGPLFLERYLDRPVEAALRDGCGQVTGRQRIVEVGNLAVSRPGYAPALIRALTDHLSNGDTRWVVFTAVPTLRNAFLKLRVPLLTLGDARPDRLSAAERRDWGSYYAGSPRVTAVSVAAAHAALFSTGHGRAVAA